MDPLDKDREVRLFVEHFNASLSLAKRARGLECCQELERQLKWFTPRGYAGAGELGVSWVCTLAGALGDRLHAAANVPGDCTKPVNRAVNLVRNTLVAIEKDVGVAHSEWVRDAYYA